MPKVKSDTVNDTIIKSLNRRETMLIINALREKYPKTEFYARTAMKPSDQTFSIIVETTVALTGEILESAREFALKALEPPEPVEVEEDLDTEMVSDKALEQEAVVDI